MFLVATMELEELGLSGIDGLDGAWARVGRGRKRDMAGHGRKESGIFGEDEVAVVAITTVRGDNTHYCNTVLGLLFN